MYEKIYVLTRWNISAYSTPLLPEKRPMSHTMPRVLWNIRVFFRLHCPPCPPNWLWPVEVLSRSKWKQGGLSYLPEINQFHCKELSRGAESANICPGKNIAAMSFKLALDLKQFFWQKQQPGYRTTNPDARQDAPI